MEVTASQSFDLIGNASLSTAMGWPAMCQRAEATQSQLPIASCRLEQRSRPFSIKKFWISLMALGGAPFGGLYFLRLLELFGLLPFLVRLVGQAERAMTPRDGSGDGYAQQHPGRKKGEKCLHGSIPLGLSAHGRQKRRPDTKEKAARGISRGAQKLPAKNLARPPEMRKD